MSHSPGSDVLLIVGKLPRVLLAGGLVRGCLFLHLVPLQVAACVQCDCVIPAAAMFELLP